jgi:hypothetical protein
MRRNSLITVALAGIAVLLQPNPARPDDGGGRLANVVVPFAGTVVGCSENVTVSGALNVQLRQFPPGPPARIGGANTPAQLSVRAELGDFAAVGRISGAAYRADGEIRFRMFPPGPPAAPVFSNAFVIPFLPPNPCNSATVPTLPVSINLIFNADGTVQSVGATLGGAVIIAPAG